MTITRAISAEMLKLRRTLAIKMVFVAPIAVVLFTLFIASQAPFTTLQQGPRVDPWRVLTRINLQFWGLLMLPLYVTLQTALIAGLDHADNQWKALFARPVPRWTIYVAKLLIVIAMATISAFVLVVAIAAEGEFFRWYDAGLGFSAAPPIRVLLRQAAQMTGLGFLFLTIQHWVSLRWRSFSVAVGVGVVATIAGMAMLLAAGPYGGWPQYFPWSLPTLVIARTPVDLTTALAGTALAGLAMAAVGCVDFCQREVQ